MNNITIFTDSCSSLTKDIIEKYDIRIIPIYFSIGDAEYNPLEEKIATEDFYNTLEGGVVARTSCINPSVFYELFEKELLAGNQVLYLAMSSGLSATYSNALSAQKELAEKYPDKIEIIDTLKGGMGMAFDVVQVAELREKGLSLKQIKGAVDKNSANIECLFTPGSISYLKRSGRINPPVALLAKVMKINPLIIADENGKLSIKSLCVGRKKTLMTLINRVVSLIHEKLRKIYLCYTNNRSEADFVCEKLKEALPDSDIKLSSIDCSLGCHCGPQALAVFYQRKAGV